MDGVLCCAKCEKLPGVVNCACGEQYCESCFSNHLDRWRNHPNKGKDHKRGDSQRDEEAWKWITGEHSDEESGKRAKVSAVASSALSRAKQKILNRQAEKFQGDEAAKWFGFHVAVENGVRIPKIVETPRLLDLMEEARGFNRASSFQQFPSIISFFGDTGAGKSHIIRALIYESNKTRQIDNPDGPVPGAQSGPSIMSSTTGEVNLYLDPSTNRDETPLCYADCEGMRGTEPLAAKHQVRWPKAGNEYPMQSRDGLAIDRRTAVDNIYPRFLYMFSDVICYVTRNPKSWGDSATKLLHWSKDSAQNAINQAVLPALILILNGPDVENHSWMSDNQDTITDDFFTAVENEIHATAELKVHAQKHGDKTMKKLLLRNFSSVHVHYIPLTGRGGALKLISDNFKQTRSLFERIKADAYDVQRRRGTTLSRSDTNQMANHMYHAFNYFASCSTDPFDLGRCRQKIANPDVYTDQISAFLGHCLKKNRDQQKLRVTAAVLASILVKNTLTVEGRGLIFEPSVIFNENTRNICSTAISDFLENRSTCAFNHPVSGMPCENTKNGHTKGHQTQSYLRSIEISEGAFIDSNFDPESFMTDIASYTETFVKRIKAECNWGQAKWQNVAANNHRAIIKNLRDCGGYPCMSDGKMVNDIGPTSTCYGCLSGQHQAEYRLPCGHVICEICLKELDQSPPDGQFSETIIHNECVICADSSAVGWPYKIQVRPDLTGLRVLSLDGGGVRGILELIILRRLENLIGLGLGLGNFFDLIIGTSAGGIIALALGQQQRSCDECIGLFRDICKSGFNAKLWTKAPNALLGVRYVARYIWGGSIYHKYDMERALKACFGKNRTRTQVFGMEYPCRVAITTTIDEEGYLIANYRQGSEDRYFQSDIPLWQAASATSAAPTFWRSTKIAGRKCRDGGLQANNPVHVAVREAKKIWTDSADFDLVLSVGCGRAENPPKLPMLKYLIPGGYIDLLKNFMSTLNGEKAWNEYKKDGDQRITNRSTRLNVRFEGSIEPSLDDLTAIPEMEKLAEKYIFSEITANLPFSPLSPIAQNNRLDSLKLLADRLCASLYYFQLDSLSPDGQKFEITGNLRCRLSPDTAAFDLLLTKTANFVVNSYALPPLDKARMSHTAMRLPIKFTQHTQNMHAPIRIDVKFGSSYPVTISGFPMTLEKLYKYWDTRSGNRHACGSVRHGAPPQDKNVNPSGTHLSDELSNFHIGERKDTVIAEAKAVTERE